MPSIKDVVALKYNLKTQLYDYSTPELVASVTNPNDPSEDYSDANIIKNVNPNNSTDMLNGMAAALCDGASKLV